jgi:CheY-like chemotaxis protein
LTEKLLTFARKKVTTTAPVDLHAIVGTTVDLLQRTMDPRIRIEMKLEAKRNHVDGDISLLQNAFLNIGLNAVQAMPDGGRLQIVSKETVLDEAYCRTSRFELRPGAYIEIAFHDTGMGISVENMEHIFEPFFTSKKPGRGTGLGLSAVYGTVQTHKGEITACSEVDVGTIFHLLLPLSEQQSSPIMQDTDTSSPIAGSGRILLVDDESAIRETAGSLLKELGYQVVCAADGREALALFETDPDGYDAVILDMIMPEMNGKDCFAALQQIRQGVRVILSSGFTQEKDLKLMLSKGLSGFVRKPYQNAELSRILAEVINS